MNLYKILIPFVFIISPTNGLAQLITEPFKFPKLPGVRKIITTNVYLDKKSPLQEGFQDIDTQQVYYLNDNGGIDSIVSFDYNRKNLVLFSYLSDNDFTEVHLSYLNDTIDSYVQYHYQYEKGKLIYRAKKDCKDMDSFYIDQKYMYSSNGTLKEKFEFHKNAKCKNYYIPVDSSHYIYQGGKQTIFHYKDKRVDTFSSVCIINTQSKATYIEEIGDDNYFKYWYNYDKKGRLIDFKLESDITFIQEDGLVLRADYTEYLYDSKGRLAKERYYTKKIPRWEYNYTYIEEK